MGGRSASIYPENALGWRTRTSQPSQKTLEHKGTLGEKMVGNGRKAWQDFAQIRLALLKKTLAKSRFVLIS